MARGKKTFDFLRFRMSDVDKPLSEIISSSRGRKFNSGGGKYTRSPIKDVQSRSPYSKREKPQRDNNKNPTAKFEKDCSFFNKPEGCQATNCGFQHRLIPGEQLFILHYFISLLLLHSLPLYIFLLCNSWSYRYEPYH
jgi:hypothetical protein